LLLLSDPVLSINRSEVYLTGVVNGPLKESKYYGSCKIFAKFYMSSSLIFSSFVPLIVLIFLQC